MSVMTSRGQTTKQALLAAAVLRFAQDGSRGATVSEIARDVGVTPASVYAYFESKEALFNASLDHDADLLMQRAVDAIGDDFTCDWGALLGMLIGAVVEHPLARRVLSGGEGMTSDRLLVIPAEARLRERLADSLRKGQANGRIRTDIDAEGVAGGLTTIVMALLIASLQAGGGIGDDDRSTGVLAVLDSALHYPVKKSAPC